MNFESRLNDCSIFLRKWKRFSEKEVLKLYPNHLTHQLEEWSDTLSLLSKEQLWQFQNEFNLSLIQSQSLKDFVNEIISLTRFESLDSVSHDLPNSLTRKLTPKKEHEISSLIKMVDELGDVQNIFDIGGGAGFLSSALLYNNKRKSYSFDLDRKLQNTGKERLEKWHPEILERLTFKNVKVDQACTTIGEGEEQRLGIGLHSCGELGTNLLRIFSNNGFEHIVLASCCYHKLNEQYNISKICMKEGLKFSINELHLASRSNRVESYQEFCDKLTLRNYRYSLHLLEFAQGRTRFQSIGNTKMADYGLSFYEYVQKYTDQNQWSVAETEEFYLSHNTRSTVRSIIALDIVRAFIGRVIETYLVLDRAQFLVGNGHKVSVREAFSRDLSPRNLVIYC